jgi:methylmalonyl-CoA mutase N-terminal domain/subunit
VNRYESDEDGRPDLLHVSEEVQDRQLSRLADVRAERDDEAVAAALDEVRAAVDRDENVMPALVDAVKAYATMGEIMDVFEAQYGAYRETVGLP